ncbi:hypothetical protein EN933_39155, partial [Mesorhizobium sp. M7A.F.Ca.US.001.01.1.1]
MPPNAPDEIASSAARGWARPSRSSRPCAQRKLLRGPQIVGQRRARADQVAVAGDADTAAKYWPPVSRIDNVAGRIGRFQAVS